MLETQKNEKSADEIAETDVDENVNSEGIEDPTSYEFDDLMEIRLLNRAFIESMAEVSDNSDLLPSAMRSKMEETLTKKYQAKSDFLLKKRFLQDQLKTQRLSMKIELLTPKKFLWKKNRSLKILESEVWADVMQEFNSRELDLTDISYELFLSSDRVRKYKDSVFEARKIHINDEKEAEKERKKQLKAERKACKRAERARKREERAERRRLQHELRQKKKAEKQAKRGKNGVLKK